MKGLVKKLLALSPLLFISLLLCVAPFNGQEQEYIRGAILDSVRYEQVDAKPVLLSRSYTSFPRSVSLKQHGPVPENQGNISSCVGWATAFTARTISESIALNRTNRELTSNSVFSPIYVYKSIGGTLRSGACIPDALDLMRSSGIVKRLPQEKTLGPMTIEKFQSISLSIYNASKRFNISGYARLYSNPTGVPGTIEARIPPVKKSLAEGKPVIIGMNTPRSFNTAKDVWQPKESPYEDYGGHAMCVVGYDDGKQGGAFEIQNSWGTNWGNGGYIWISYRDFAAFAYEAYEIIENLATYRDAARFAATIKIEVYGNNRGMPVAFDPRGFYKTRASYPAGTDFRFMMTNRHPAYVYAFSSDAKTPGTGRIFPLPGVSPVLDYKDSAIAWPGENEWIRLDDVAGTDYLVVLFSKEALDIGAIERRFANAGGTFPERVARAVGSNFIPYNEIKYGGDMMEFSAASGNSKAVFGLLLAIGHL